MTYQQTVVDLRVSELMSRVEALDPELYGELSTAHCDQMSETEDRAVLFHGRQILAAIEGRGYAGDAGAANYDDDSRWVAALDGPAAQ
jgi:hypothetical protein